MGTFRSSVTVASIPVYEFQNGPLPDFTNIGQAFLEEFSHYVTASDSIGLIGLRILRERARNKRGMSELILDQGTIMLDTSVIKKCQTTQVTCWKFEASIEIPRVCQSNETHLEMIFGI